MVGVRARVKVGVRVRVRVGVRARVNRRGGVDVGRRTHRPQAVVGLT